VDVVANFMFSRVLFFRERKREGERGVGTLKETGERREKASEWRRRTIVLRGEEGENPRDVNLFTVEVPEE